jgi:thiol-disulfide isomerase/thioredoxin
MVAGFVLVLIFVMMVRIPGGHRSRHWFGPGGQRHLLGPGGQRHLLGLEYFASTPTFTMFGVDWCPHCVKAKPIFESAGSTVTIGGHVVNFRYVNPETDKEAAKGFAIDGYPTFYLEKDGQKIKYAGPRTKQGFSEFLHKEFAA